MTSTELSFIDIERNNRMFFDIQEAPVDMKIQITILFLNITLKRKY